MVVCDNRIAQSAKVVDKMLVSADVLAHSVTDLDKRLGLPCRLGGVDVISYPVNSVGAFEKVF